MNTIAWRVTLAATALMALATGLRVSGGLFVSPLNSATGLGLATLSLLYACGQLALGFSQPMIGALADRLGSARVVVLGAIALAAATALMAWPTWVSLAAAPTSLVLTVALVTAAVAQGAVGGNALLVGELNRRLPAAHVGFAVGLVGAGGSLGQLVVGPATQHLIDRFDGGVALCAGAALALVAIPLAGPLRRPVQLAASRPAQPLADVLRDALFWRMAASFGICGFHVSFLAVHMPGVIERCGLPASLAGPWLMVAGAANIAGSIAIGHAMRTHDNARLLVALYLVRALGITALLLASPSQSVLLLFALVMGASHMVTLPPTAQWVARRHGVARLSSLLGVVMLVHQLGGFAGISLGGWAAEATGSDRLLWLVDIALALAAALLVWPLRGRAEPAGEMNPIAAARA